MTETAHRFTRRSLLGLIAAALMARTTALARAAQTVVKVHKDPNCECCSGWVQHLRDAGFAVEVTDTPDLVPVKKRYGVPPEFASCHTAEVSGYVLEGHVPAAAVQRLLAERPKALGLAVPGMPVGSPGMEGEEAQPYTVMLFGPADHTPYMHFVGARVVDR